MARVTSVSAATFVEPWACNSEMNCSRRPSSISAILYRICPLLKAVLSDQPPKAFLAATTAFLTSFLELKQILPSGFPFLSAGE